ncbi:MAG: YcxB family protein [Pseudomonadota bacterium]
MQVTTTINRMDIVWLNVSQTFRMRSNWYFFAFFFAVCIFALWDVVSDPDLTVSWWIIVILALVLASVAFLFFGVFCTLWNVFSATAKSGLIGEHVYAIEDEGIRAKSHAGESIRNWDSLESVSANKRAILIQIVPGMFYIIPRRAFKSSSDFENFYAQLTETYERHSAQSRE